MKDSERRGTSRNTSRCSELDVDDGVAGLDKTSDDLVEDELCATGQIGQFEQLIKRPNIEINRLISLYKFIQVWMTNSF